MSKYLIYALVDPRTGQVRYVGKSATGMKRPRQHWEPAALEKDTNKYKKRWLLKLIRRGLTPNIVLLEICATAEETTAAEVAWIACFKRVSAPITNLTSGGDGAGLGNQIWQGKTHTKATREKLSRALKGNKNSLGYKHSAEAIARSSAGSRGLKRSAAVRLKLRNAKLGKKRGPHSQETKAKMSAALVLLWKVRRGG